MDAFWKEWTRSTNSFRRLIGREFRWLINSWIGVNIISVSSSCSLFSSSYSSIWSDSLPPSVTPSLSKFGSLCSSNLESSKHTSVESTEILNNFYGWARVWRYVLKQEHQHLKIVLRRQYNLIQIQLERITVQVKSKFDDLVLFHLAIIWGSSNRSNQ